MPTDKAALTEQDIRSKFISLAIIDAGWHAMRQVREAVQLTKGGVIVRGKLATRGEAKRAAYVPYHRSNLPLAVVAAKHNTHPVGAGMQQALGYAALLEVRFAFSSNGDSFLLHDATGFSAEVEQEFALEAFPSPDEPSERYRTWKGLNAENERIVAQEDHDDGSGKDPRN